LTHSVQLTQLVPSAALLNDRDSDYITEVANTTDTQHIHLIYQLLLAGKRDLQWASSAQVGFEMLMLRLLAFEPQYGTSTTSTAQQPPPRGDNEE
ncbi:AAA family ATPase, partial [Pseudoalteromonas sp. S3260]